MDDEDEAFEALLQAALLDADTEPALMSYANTAPAVMQALARLEPMRTACAFGALLLEPGLQGSCLRLEALVHMALKAGRGDRKPTKDGVAHLFAAMGASALRPAESEAETLFVGLITSRRGGFRVLEGSWVGSSFNLQRVVDIVDDLPADPRFKPIVDSVFALLKMSDLACERARLRRYTPGQFAPSQRLSRRYAGTAMERRRYIRFTRKDLMEAGIKPDDVAPFVLPYEKREDLFNRGWGGTPLERHPVLQDGDAYHLVLASSVSLAIRRFVVESMDTLGERPAFAQALGNAHAKWFMGVRHFGNAAKPELNFQPVGRTALASVTRLVDTGRPLQIIFALDTLDQIEVTGFEAFNPDFGSAAQMIDRLIGEAHASAAAATDFRDGLTLVVACGIGRPTGLTLEPTKRTQWRVETIGAADLETLSQGREISALSLWRLLDARDRLHAQGARLFLTDGLLQLAGQARLGDGHLVEHGQFEDGAFAEGRIGILQASPYAMLRMRQEAAENWDRQVLSDTRGRWRQISKKGLPLFDEDLKAPTYIELEPPVRGVFVSDKRTWWWRLVNRTTDRGAQYQRWQTLEAWMRRAAPVLDAAFPTLGAGPIEWVAVFDDELSTARPDSLAIDFEAARASISASADMERREVRTHATATFEQAFAVVDNIAERALVESLVLAVAMLAGKVLNASQTDAMVERIVPDTRARQTHAFRNPSFRDYVRGSLKGEVVTITREVDASLRIGLGWKVLGPGDSPTIEGKSANLSFLRTLVTRIEDDLIEDIRLLDRRALVSALVTNHELAAIEIDDFKRTSAAILAFHVDKSATLRTLGVQEAKLNIVSLTCRILLEVAVCEAPLAGGRNPGTLDLERLMGLMSMIFHFGGDSDAIRWDVMRPFTRVTPLGDVHAHRDFETDIFEPYGQKNADLRFQDAAESYAENVEAAAEREPGTGPDAAFLKALEDTLGAPAVAFEVFVIAATNHLVDAGKAYLMLPRSQVVQIGTEAGLDPDIAGRVVDALTFLNRTDWRTLPEGHPDADRQPWRFRRQLSVLRQPLVRLDSQDDPSILVAPGLIRQAWDYIYRNLQRGDFHDRHLSKSMISWKARIADKRGKAFAVDVRDRLKAAGWETDLEVAMTKLLDQGFDRDYGDVDVLAWRPDDGRVLMIECKDVQYRKTFGEIAEQLADFRGEINDKGKRDYLRKHLDRIDLARANLPAVAKFVEMANLGSVESHLVFRNPVPMKYALDTLSQRVATHIFSEIDDI